MKITENIKRKVNARHQRHLLTKFDNNFFEDLLDALDQRVLNRWSKLSEQKLRFFSRVKI